MQAAHQVCLLPALVHRRGLHSCLHLKQRLMCLLELTRKVLVGPCQLAVPAVGLGGNTHAAGVLGSLVTLCLPRHCCMAFEDTASLCAFDTAKAFKACCMLTGRCNSPHKQHINMAV